MSNREKLEVNVDEFKKLGTKQQLVVLFENVSIIKSNQEKNFGELRFMKKMVSLIGAGLAAVIGYIAKVKLT